MIPLKNLIRVVAIVLLVLAIPLVLTIRDGGVEGVGWNWTASDFVIMGTLLFVTGLGIEYALRKITQPFHKVVAVVVIVFVLLVVWAQLAVGAVSQMLEFLST